MAKRILFVDDENQILRALKRVFVNSDYEVAYLNSGKQALQYLNKNPVDLIVSDIRMAEMDGFELLSLVKQRFPSILRVALSGYTDSKKVYKALEENIAKMYLFKPWDNYELVAIIKHLFDLENLLKNQRLLGLINTIDKLPTVPQLYLDIKHLIQQDADIDLIAQKIEEDPSISSRILRVSNSAYYGSGTGSISQAIMYIGLANVKNIVLSNGVFNCSSDQSPEMITLWQCAVTTNKITNLIYKDFIGKRIPNLFASAGLLHNIGKIIMFTYYSDSYSQLLKKSLSSNIPLDKIEKDYYGLTHQEIGGYLLNWWGIPLPIVEATLYHHQPLNENILHKELVGVVHLANYYTWQWLGRPEFAGPIEPDVLTSLKIDRDTLESTLRKTFQATQRF